MGGHLSRIRRDHEHSLRSREHSSKCDEPREDSTVAEDEVAAVQPPPVPDGVESIKDHCSMEEGGSCSCDVCTMIREAGSEYFESCFSEPDSAFDEDELPPSTPNDPEPSFKDKSSQPELPDQSTVPGAQKGVLLEDFYELTIQSFRAGTKLTEPEILKVKSFDELLFPSRRAFNIAIAGYSKPTLIQKNAMRSILEGKDVMACCPSGVGLTASFLLPIVSRILQEGIYCGITKAPCMPRVLIVVPTHDLAIKIHQEATKFVAGTFCNCDLLYGGSSFRYQQHRVVRGVSILIGTVDRIKRFIIKGIISLKHTKCLVLCGANRLLDMGSSENLHFILRNGKIPSRDKRQTLLLSPCELPLHVQEHVKSSKLLKDDHLTIIVEKISKCVIQDVVRVTRCAKKAKLLEMIGVGGEKYEHTSDLEIYKQKTIIFVDTNKMADMLAVFLSGNGIVTNIIHAEHNQAQREAVVDDFRKGTTPILIVTGEAERLDISGVDHVINYDMPSEIGDYVYRIGRTGSIDSVGHSTSFYDPDQDGHIVDPLINLLVMAGQSVPHWLKDARVPYWLKGITSPEEVHRRDTVSEFLLQLDTDKVEFTSEELGEEACTSVVKIKNTQKDKYLYKVKCSSNELFRIRPSLGYIKPGDTEVVTLTFYAGNPVPESGKHYFVVCYMKADGDVDPRSAWSEKEPEAMKRLYINFSKKKKEEGKSIHFSRFV